MADEQVASRPAPRRCQGREPVGSNSAYVCVTVCIGPATNYFLRQSLAIRGGNAQSGGLTNYFDRQRPAGYHPMKKEAPLGTRSSAEQNAMLVGGSSGRCLDVLTAAAPTEPSCRYGTAGAAICNAGHTASDTLQVYGNKRLDVLVAGTTMKPRSSSGIATAPPTSNGASAHNHPAVTRRRAGSAKEPALTRL
ncbi:arabinofuranosidase catalytic domain-containing protein [Catelliglobosispora koreensis]|uniref:arabinofuranosidase catalytic domain-containing protein n=1 Tax=Catelliglobosispora koreensis TaxID=129052 RepID=UPI001FE16D9A|nr:arabinofuranosidase catalytic domain-containing protein [Catelliglobosispora koreensis]